MLGIRSLQEVNLHHKTIMLRVDFNVPMDNGKIVDDTRIDLAIPSIIYALDKGSKVILISHLGTPKSGDTQTLSLKPVVSSIEEKLHRKVHFTDLENLGSCLSATKVNEVILLENIRFYPEELECSESFANTLASYADVYVNEAFSCSHRDHTSITLLPKAIGNYCAGIHLAKEVETLSRIINNPVLPLTLLLGGSKVETKYKIMDKFLRSPNIKKICLGGVLANSILKHLRYEIGKSVIHPLPIDMKYDPKLELPQDVRTCNNTNGQDHHLCTVDNVPPTEQILDLGPATVFKYAKLIESSGTVIWNGPLGYCESPIFRESTTEIASLISHMTKNSGLVSLIGGGDTLASLPHRQDLCFTHVSVGGGAFLAWLESRDLIGLQALRESCLV